MKRIKFLFLLYLVILFCIPLTVSASTLSLPADLLHIDAEAFMNDTSLDCVEIPEGMLTIGERAFAGSSVRKIVLPESIEAIADNAFAGCAQLTLHVKKDSYAHSWCKTQQMPYELIKDAADDTDDADDYYLALKFSNVFQPTEWNYKASQKFADMVTERTNGHITVTYYGQNQLDCYSDSVTQAVNGSAWIGLEEPSLFADYVGDCAALIGPMLYHSDAEYNHVMDSALVDDIKDRLAKENIHILDTHYTFGFRSIMTNRVFRTPEDLHLAKIRTSSSALYINTLIYFGATAVGMSFTECLTAIPLGIVEGFEGSISTLRGAGAPYELVKKVSLTNHLIASRWMFMPEDLYQSIPEKWRKILDECAVECGKWEQEMVAQDEAEQIAFLKTYGVTFHEVDLDAFTEASADVHEWIAEEYGADPALSGKIIKLVQDYRNAN